MVAPEYSISLDPVLDWNSFCGLHAGDNFCSRSLSSGFLYESWLYLVILPLLTPDSIGILSVAYMPVIISVHGVCHLAYMPSGGWDIDTLGHVTLVYWEAKRVGR